jgi:predicted transcriptional regulator
MKKRVMRIKILILSFYFGIFLVTGACGALNGYTVEAVTLEMDTGTPLETVAVEFWDLPFGIMLFSLTVSLSSITGFPIEVFFIIKFYTYLGYRKISRETVFHNNTRIQIYSCIRDNPGIFFNKLVCITKIKRGTIRYHLSILKMMQKITLLDSSGNARYFVNSGKYSENEKYALKYIRNDVDCVILGLLLEKPEVTRKELGMHLRLSLSTISWRMKRLSDENIILIENNGKIVRYKINTDMLPYLKKYLS